jgi:integrase
MSVKIKEENLKGGRKSLYLDVYIDQNNFYRKSLKLYLQPEKTQSDKELNKKVKRLAEKIRNQYEAKVLEDKHNLKDPREKFDYSFMKFFSLLVEQRYESNKCYDAWRSAQNYLESYSNGDIRFEDINEYWLEGLKIHLSKFLAPNSANTYYSKVKRAIYQALRGKLLDFDPTDIKAPQAADTDRQFLTVEELKLIKNTECRCPLIKRVFLFSCTTGLRWSDCQKLKWGEIICEEGIHYLQFKQQKTGRLLKTPMTDQAFEFIGDRKEDQDLVFPNLSYSAHNNLKLHRWIFESGIKKHITFHSARHTYACLLLNSGIEIYTVSKMMGHRDLKTTQIYAKLVDQSKVDAIAKIPRLFE